MPGEFGRWNKESIGSGLPTALNADNLLAKSELNYTTLRLPWLNDRDVVKYEITKKNDQYVGVSGSRQSIADPAYGARNSLVIADPATKSEDRPVY